MARCRCSALCACYMVAGPGITITGTGTEDNPFIISLTEGGSLMEPPPLGPLMLELEPPSPKELESKED